jgi:hypothetical protein
MTRQISLRFAFAALPALFLVAAGCGDGSGSHTISGKVTHKGKAVPKGFITFIPDTSKGNSGPGGGAEIINGEYTTPDDKGIHGGAYIVQIVGFDGVPYSESGEEIPEGKSLFAKYQLAVDLPKESTTKDFTVPDVVTPMKRGGGVPGDDRDGF